MNGKRVDKEIEKISHGLLRQSSIDSILSLISLLKDTFINRINPFVMSGSIYYVTVANGTDTTRFKMINTFDYTALKIVNIINQYLPSDNKLWASEELIKQEKESREWFYEMSEEEKKKKDSIQSIPHS
jgi:site-specific DNA-adenine methylase